MKKSGSAVVIGAGVSGLAASYLLSKQGYNVTILEKGDKAGGRLKEGKFRDGTKYETGALWIHNSDHPVAKVFEKTGGVYQDYNEENFIIAPLNYHIINPFLKNPFLHKLEDALIKYHSLVKDLSWDALLDIISDYKDHQEEYLVELRDILTGKHSRLDWLVSRYYGLDPQDDNFKYNVTNLLWELGIDLGRDSVTASRYYTGGRETHYLPKSGYSKVVDYLLAKASNEGVKIKYNTAVNLITENQVVTGNESIDTDLIVSAISAADYKNIEIKETAEGSLNAGAVKVASERLYPSGMKKVVLEISHKIDISSLESIKLENDGYVSIVTNGESNVVYALTYWGNPLELCVKGILNHIKERYNLVDIVLKDKAEHYGDGKSWYKQGVGFDPVISNQKVVYTGTLTGADDSVHSSLTAICERLSSDTDLCLKGLFATPVPEQLEL